MRLNVYVPDELGQTMRAARPDLNVSGLLQEALRQVLECDHSHAVCADCGVAVSASTSVGEALEDFWQALLWAWEPLVDRQGTAEGAARVAKTVAVEMGVPMADCLPLPRPTRKRRAA